MRIVITYNPVTRETSIVENDFSCIEAFGVLEFAKQMIAADQFNGEE